MHIDVLSVGSAIIDLFLQIHDDEKVVSVDAASRTIAFPQGAKILLDKCEPRLGGNASNVAVGLRRLGLKSALMAEIENDEFSEKIVNGLRDEDVDISHILRSDGQTSLNIGINFHKERTIFTMHQKHDHLFKFDFQADWIYLTSLGNAWEHVYEEVATLIRSKKSLLAFNPGSVQYAAGAASFSHFLQITDILFLNKEEATVIVGEHAKDLDLVRALVHKGVKIPVLTDGKNGAYSVDESGEYFHQPARSAEVVEVTGAGDAFSSGFLSAYILKKSIREAMKWGIANSTSVIGEIGAQPGLLHREKMEVRAS